jgi:hypothetical protein
MLAIFLRISKMANSFDSRLIYRIIQSYEDILPYEEIASCIYTYMTGLVGSNAYIINIHSTYQKLFPIFGRDLLSGPVIRLMRMNNLEQLLKNTGEVRYLYCWN